MKNKIHVSSSPHIVTRKNTPYLMRMVLLALTPAALFSLINFGWRALFIILISMLSCVLWEAMMNAILHKKNSIYDASAFVTGLLLAMNLPVSAPWWLPIIGSAFAIVIVKMLFGGLGQNVVNPALAARCFLLISFAGYMCDFGGATPLLGSIDAMASATPLAIMKEGANISLWHSFLGLTSGTIGETSTLLLLMGGLFLCFTHVIDWRIPVSYLTSFAISILLLGSPTFDFYFLACHLCNGGIMLGAWFMATDYVTSPITPKGRLLFGILLGILTALFRINSIEGVSYAILFGNLLVPLIEKVTIKTAFGRRGDSHA